MLKMKVVPSSMRVLRMEKMLGSGEDKKRKFGGASNENHISSGNGSEESLLKESAPVPRVIKAVSSSTMNKNKEKNGFQEPQTIGIKQEPENKSFKSSLDTTVNNGKENGKDSIVQEIINTLLTTLSLSKDKRFNITHLTPVKSY